MTKSLFPRAMRKIAMLAWIFDECREGQYPAACGGVIDLSNIPDKKQQNIFSPCLTEADFGASRSYGYARPHLGDYVIIVPS